MAILMHAHLLAESEDGRAVGRRAADAITRGATRMNSLIEGLLLYARAEGAVLDRTPVDVDTMVCDVARELSVVADSPVRVTREELPSLWVEPVLFRQVVANVLGNGVKYVAPGIAPRVHVSAHRDPATDAWTLRFADNGIGIAPESRERVFDVFHRETTDYPGTGIGLAICRRIVERHGGKIWIEPGPDGGSVVHVRMPCE